MLHLVLGRSTGKMSTPQAADAATSVLYQVYRGYPHWSELPGISALLRSTSEVFNLWSDEDVNVISPLPQAALCVLSIYPDQDLIMLVTRNIDSE